MQKNELNSQVLTKNGSCQYIGNGRIKGEMYSARTFPIVIKGPSKVYGDIYLIKNKRILNILDNIKGSMMNRELVYVELSLSTLEKFKNFIFRKDKFKAWCYFADKSLVDFHNLDKITNGKYIGTFGL